MTTLVVFAAVVFVGWFVLVTLLRALSSGPAPAKGEIPWQPGVDEAMSLAAREKRPVMVDFYTDWCSWCRKMDREVFARRDVADAAGAFISVRTNPEKDALGTALAKKHGISAFPTILFLDAGGQEIHRVEGYRSPTAFLGEMKEALRKSQDPDAPRGRSLRFPPPMGT